MAQPLEQPSFMSNSEALALPQDFDRFLAAFDQEDWRQVLVLAKSIRARLAVAEIESARTAQKRGATWEEIGATVGVSKQSAHKRWGEAPSNNSTPPRKRK